MSSRNSTLQHPAARALASAMAVLCSVLSLFSFLAILGSSPIVATTAPATARCDAGERHITLDRRVEPARGHAVRPARGSEGASPLRVRVTPFPALGAIAAVREPRSLAEQQRARRPYAIDASIPRARRRAERMVFLI